MDFPVAADKNGREYKQIFPYSFKVLHYHLEYDGCQTAGKKNAAGIASSRVGSSLAKSANLADPVPF